MADDSYYEMTPMDPKNNLTSVIGGIFSGSINGKYFSAPAYVDEDGFVRVRMPKLRRQPAGSDKPTSGEDATA